MDSGLKLTITAGALKNATPEQFKALQENVLADGIWENARGCVISGGLSGEIAVEPLDGEGRSMIYMGIERDGYTHS